MKYILLCIIFLLSLSQVKSQKIIENPQTGFVSSDVNIKIEKVTLTDSATNITFTANYPAGRKLNIPKETYFQPVGDTTKYFIKNSTGAAIGFENVMPASGKLNYTLIFPKIDSDTRVIDFGEDLPQGKKVYDIHLIKDNRYKLPDELYGNWYNTKNSRLEYAFFLNHVVYNNQVWKYDQVKYDNNKGTILIRNGKQKHNIHFSGAVNNSYKIDNKTYTRFIENCNKVFSKEKYALPVLKMDTAIYSGYIKNYNDRIGDKAITISVNDIITGGQNKIFAKINEEGYFSAKVPLYHPGEVYVKYPYNEYSFIVFLEPGKSLFTIIENTDTYLMGDMAELNNNLRLLKKVDAYNYFEMPKLVVDMSPEQYKTYINQLQKTEHHRLDSIYQSGSINEKAYQIKIRNIYFRNAIHLFEYKWNYEAAYRKKYGLKQDEKVNTDPVPVSYFDFLKNTMLNDELAVLAPSYNTFINRLKFMDILDNIGELSLSIENRKDYLDKNGYKYTAEEKQLLDSLDYVEEDKTLAKSFNKRQDNLWRSFSDNHSAFLFANDRNHFKVNFLDSAYGIKNGFTTNIMFAQDIAHPIAELLKPLLTIYLENFDHEITTPFIPHYINIRNDQTVAKLKAYKATGGHVVNNTPNVAADKMFETIMEKYKGKVVYIDFWATWCGPCLSGIHQIRALKEELKDKNVAFIYITDESSSLQTWENMIPTIRGEHYRLDPDNWNYLASKFNITGIPHYMLVDTNGKVLNPHLSHMDNTALQNLLEKYIK